MNSFIKYIIHIIRLYPDHDLLSSITTCWNL